MKKKSFITIGAAAIAVAGVLAGCGGGAGTQTTTAKSSSDATIETVEEVTAQSIAKTVSEKMDEVKSYSFDGERKMNYAVSASGTDMSVKMDMKLNGEGVVESKQVHMNADMDMEMLGQEIKVKSEAYAVEEDGKYVVYTKSEGSGVEEGWTKQVTDTKIEFDKLNNLSVYKQIADGNIEAVLTEGEKINGKDVYKITAKIPGEIFQETFTALGSDSTSQFSTIDFSAASANCELYVYKDTGFPARTYMDAKEYGESIFKQAASQTGSADNIAVSVDDFFVDVTMDNYNAIDKIEIPADVKESAKEVTE